MSRFSWNSNKRMLFKRRPMEQMLYQSCHKKRALKTLLKNARGKIRTRDLLVRSQTLYPTGLHAHIILNFHSDGSARQPARLARPRVDTVDSTPPSRTLSPRLAHSLAVRQLGYTRLLFL